MQSAADESGFGLPNNLEWAIGPGAAAIKVALGIAQPKMKTRSDWLGEFFFAGPDFCPGNHRAAARRRQQRQPKRKRD